MYVEPGIPDKRFFSAAVYRKNLSDFDNEVAKEL